MDWQPQMFNGMPIAGQPKPKNKNKNAQQMFYTDQNGNLIIPGGAGGNGAGFRRASFDQGSRPTSIVINNSQWEENSPERPHAERRHSERHRSRRRSSDSRYASSSDSSDDSRSHSRDRRRHRRHSKHYNRRKSRSPSRDVEKEKLKERLADLERKEEDEEARRRFEEEKILEQAKEAKKKREQEEMKKAAIEEWKTKELEKELKEKEAEEKADQIYQKRVRAEFAAKGYSEESIEEFLKKKKKEDKKKNKEHEKAIDLSRPTYIKVHRKYLSTDTLDIYELPWEWDEFDKHFIIIKTWIPEADQEILFEHTRKLRTVRETRLLEDSAPIVAKQKKDRDMLLVRRKSSPKNNRQRSRSRSIVIRK